MIPRVELEGKFFRDVDRLMGRLPALDAALQRKMPWARDEVGKVIAARAKAEAPRRSGALAEATGHRVSGDELAVGTWGIPYAYPIELGVNNTPMIVGEHTRLQTVVFGTVRAPVTVKVKEFVRRTKMERQQYLRPAYYASFSAMFGILNKAIEDAKAEVGLADD